MDRRHLLKNSLALGGLAGPGASMARPGLAQTAPNQGARNGLPKGYGSSNEVPDRAEAERAVRVMKELFSRFPANPA
jgi:hypothetical protein